MEINKAPQIYFGMQFKEISTSILQLSYSILWSSQIQNAIYETFYYIFIQRYKEYLNSFSLRDGRYNKIN